jgi:hypothetical protein
MILRADDPGAGVLAPNRLDSRRLVMLILALSCTSIASTQAMERYPFLAWETRAVASPESAQEHMYHLVTVSAIEADGAVRWTFALPERMHALRLEDWQQNNLRRLRAEWRELVRSKQGEQTLTGIAYGAKRLWIYGPWYDVIYQPEAITVADATGVLVLDPNKGKQLLDYHRPGGASIYDSGDIAIERATSEGQVLCQRQDWPPTFLIPCGEWMVYFNGFVAAVVSGVPPSVIAETPLRAEHRQAKSARVGFHDWLIPVGPVRIRLSGMSFME